MRNIDFNHKLPGFSSKSINKIKKKHKPKKKISSYKLDGFKKDKKISINKQLKKKKFKNQSFKRNIGNFTLKRKIKENTLKIKSILGSKIGSFR